MLVVFSKKNANDQDSSDDYIPVNRQIIADLYFFIFSSVSKKETSMI